MIQYEVRNVGFDVPTERRARQNLESELIEKWRSPFNRESWKFWGQPFY